MAGMFDRVRGIASASGAFALIAFSGGALAEDAANYPSKDVKERLIYSECLSNRVDFDSFI